MDGVGVLVVEYENIVVAAAGGNGKPTGLIGVRLEDFLLGKEHAAKLVCFGSGRVKSGITVRIWGGSNVLIDVGISGWAGGRGFG